MKIAFKAIINRAYFKEKEGFDDLSCFDNNPSYCRYALRISGCCKFTILADKDVAGWFGEIPKFIVERWMKIL
jgi:hypothetical protein